MAKLTTVLGVKNKVSKALTGVSSKLKSIKTDQEKLTKSTTSTKSAVGKLAGEYRKQGLTASEAMTRAWKETEKVKKSVKGLGTNIGFSSLTSSAGKFFSFMRKQIFSLRSLLLGLGGLQLFKFTIGGAAEIEQLKTFLQLQLGSEGASALEFIDKRARESIFSFEELSKAARSFSTILKDTSEIENFTKFAERLSFLDPAQGFEGAALALKEVLSGETRSLRQRFELPISDALQEAVKSGDLDAITKALDELIPVTEEQLDELAKTGSGSFKRLSSNISTSFKQAGDTSLQFLKPILAELNDSFQEGRFDAFFNDFALGLAIIVSFLINTVMWIQKVFGWLLINGPAIVGVVFAITAAVGTYMLVTKGAALATSAWGIAQKALNILMNLNPIGIIIALVVGLIVAIVALIGTNEKFRKGFAKVFGFVVDFFEGVVNFILGGYNLMITGVNGLKDIYFSIWGGIFNFILDGVDSIIAALNKIPGVDIDLSTDQLRDKLNGAIDIVKDADFKQTEFKADFTKFKEAGQAAIENFDAKKLVEKIKGGFEDKFAIPEIEAGEVTSQKFETQMFGAEGDQGFTLNEFIIDEFGNILDGVSRDSFVENVEDNRRVEVKIFENAEISGDTDLEALKDIVMEAIEEALDEDVDTNSSLIPKTA